MTNEQFSDAIYDLKLKPRMENMAWLAMFNESSWLDDYFLGYDLEDVQKLFPEFDESIETLEEVSDFLHNHKKYGFLAEIHFPSIVSTNFDDDGALRMTRTTYGLCSVVYVYGETIEDFFKEVVKAHDEELKRQIEKIKNK